MKVLTYIKDLPVKLTNQNKRYISLVGATLYIDEEANRYAYVCFDNHYKKPFFALILNLTQYDVGGHLIKKEKYYVPNCFGNKGKSVLEKPINVDKECEALEVEIALAVFTNKIFANDQLRQKNTVRFEFPRISNDPLMPKGNAANFDWPEKVEEPVEEEAIPVAIEEEAPVEEKVVEEVKETKAAPTIEDIEDDEEIDEEDLIDEDDDDFEEDSIIEDIEEEEEEKAIEPAPTKVEESLDDNTIIVRPEPRKKSILLRIVLPFVVFAISLAIFLLVFFVVKSVVPPTPYR